ncbi:MAG: hypothetical protein ACHQ15_04645 [Candidatus Limnocylindrales bacterium]
MPLPAGTHARAIDIGGAARPELLSLARGRRLLIDWFKAKCCGTNVGVGDVSLRWIDPDVPLDDDDWVRLDDLEPLEAYAQRDIVALLARAGARLEVGGIGPFRKPTVVISDGDPWVDFFDTCRPRSALRH